MKKRAEKITTAVVLFALVCACGPRRYKCGPYRCDTAKPVIETTSERPC